MRDVLVLVVDSPRPLDFFVQGIIVFEVQIILGREVVLDNSYEYQVVFLLY
ncbi:hypothetical protein DSUL_20249 [Desulfovibrionales bacterium]